MIRSRPVWLLVIGLYVLVIACHYYADIGPDEVADHSRVRVTTVDGQREDIREPRVEADSIKGLVDSRSSRFKRDRDEPVAVPLDQVSTLEVERTSVGATVLLLLPLVAVMSYAIACETGQGSHVC